MGLAGQQGLSDQKVLAEISRLLHLPKNKMQKVIIFTG
jgi:hypothetical protein